MGDKNILKNVIREFKPDYVVPEIEALSIEALKELEDEGFKIVANARTVEITMNRDKIRDLASRELKIKTAKFDYIFEFEDLEKIDSFIYIKTYSSSPEGCEDVSSVIFLSLE